MIKYNNMSSALPALCPVPCALCNNMNPDFLALSPAFASSFDNTLLVIEASAGKACALCNNMGHDLLALSPELCALCNYMSPEQILTLK